MLIYYYNIKFKYIKTLKLTGNHIIDVYENRPTGATNIIMIDNPDYPPTCVRIDIIESVLQEQYPHLYF